MSEPILRVLTALAVGLLVGAPLGRRPGGLRTHALVAMGCAVFCTIANSLATDTDTLRVVQGITSGVGFIGASAVLKLQGAIYGINVAASIWLASALACQVVLGDWTLGVALGALLASVNYVLKALDKWTPGHVRRVVPSEHAEPSGAGG